MSLSGTLIPMVFLFCLNIFGTFAPAFKIKVNGPGKRRFINLYVGLEMGEVNSDKLLSPWHKIEKCTLFGFLLVNLQIAFKTSL